MSALQKTRALSWKILEFADALLVVPVLLVIFIASMFASIPELGTFFISVGTAFIQGDPSKVDANSLQSLSLPVTVFLVLTLLHHSKSSKQLLVEGSYAVQKQITDAIASVNGVEFREFPDELELKRYLNRITLEAKESVDDLTWAHRKAVQGLLPRPADQQIEWEALEAEHATIVAQISKTKIYREIFILSREDRISKILRRKEEAAPLYFCKVLGDAQIPRLQFVVVDKREVVFISSNHRVLCSIKHPKLGKVFMDYFEDAWSMGTSVVEVEGGKAVWREVLLYQEVVSARERLQNAERASG